jgi:hypothetical protein
MLAVVSGRLKAHPRRMRQFIDRLIQLDAVETKTLGPKRRCPLRAGDAAL